MWDFCWCICPKRCVEAGYLPQKYTSGPSFALLVVHVFVCQYVLQHEHGVLLAVAVGGLQLGEHGPDLRGVMRDVHLCLIGFQDRVLCALRLRPVGLALVLFRGLTEDLLDALLAALITYLHVLYSATLRNTSQNFCTPASPKLYMFGI